MILYPITISCLRGLAYGVVVSHYVLRGDGTYTGTHLIPRATSDVEQVDIILSQVNYSLKRKRGPLIMKLIDYNYDRTLH